MVRYPPAKAPTTLRNNLPEGMTVGCWVEMSSSDKSSPPTNVNEGPALQHNLMAEDAAQARVMRIQFISNRCNGGWTLNLKRDLALSISRSA